MANILEYDELGYNSQTALEDIIFYSVKINTPDPATDYHITADTVARQILGDSIIENLDRNDVFYLKKDNGNRHPISFGKIDDIMMGTTEFETLNSEINFRIVNSAGDRGYTNIITLSNYINDGEELAEITDIANYSVYLRDDDGVRYNTQAQLLIDAAIGSTVSTGIEPDSVLYYKKADGSKKHILLSDLTKVISPSAEIDAALYNSTLKFSTMSVDGNNITYGTVTYEEIIDTIISAVDLPVYTGGDGDVDDDVKFAYLNDGVYGYISLSGMKSTLFNNEQLELSSMSDQDKANIVMRAVNGTIPYPDIVADMMENFNEVFNLNPENRVNDINDDDGFIYVTEVTDGFEYKNISYLTIKDKILTIDDSNESVLVDIDDSTRITIGDRFMTLGTLKAWLANNP